MRGVYPRSTTMMQQETVTGMSKLCMVRPEGESSNPPGPIDTENLFKTLEEWNHHLNAHASLSQTPFA